ncbi:MAG: hypothetical protein ACK40Z_14730, partial [Dietzia sp.]
PSACQAPSQEIDDNWPVSGNLVKGDSCRSKWQGESDDDQAHGLVEDHGLQRGEPERSYEQGKSELSAAQTDQSSKGSYGSSSGKRGYRII